MKNKNLRTLLSVAAGATTALLLSVGIHAQQMADPGFRAVVEDPAYRERHPKVVIDEAHSNFHTAGGRYKPFADLLRSDGYEVVPGTTQFETKSLDGVDVLVVSNASTPNSTNDASASAFTKEECDAVRDWVRAGGSLLLIADHTPFGSAAEPLANRFGVELGKGFVFDFKNSETNPTVLVFSRENGLLGQHPLLDGRNAVEEVKRVVAFTGESLSVPAGATALLKLGATAYESASREELRAALEATARNAETGGAGTSPARPVSGRAQAVAMNFGKGRVVVVGEAAMFSAQIARFAVGNQPQEFKMGMNAPGNEDRQFALNILHWLSGLLK